MLSLQRVLIVRLWVLPYGHWEDLEAWAGARDSGESLFANHVQHSKTFRAPLLFLHFSLPPLSPPLQLEASFFSGVGRGHAPDGEGGGGGSSALESGGPQGM